MHGLQYAQQDRRRWATSYYSADSGVGLAIASHPQRAAGGRLRLGVVGLGAGTLAAFAEPGDQVVFYEINPIVAEFAEQRFTYLSDARQRGAQVDVVLGDARVVLERQLAAGDGQRFDVLAVDAFSSDSVPLHLLTREAFAVYRQHLAAGGVLAIHVSNLFLDLSPAVRKVAQVEELHAVSVLSESDSDQSVYGSQWVLLSADRKALQTESIVAAQQDWPPLSPDAPLWTDDYCSLFQLLH